MGVGEERAADLHAGVGDSRTVGVKEILLGFPVGVTGVAGVVDVGQVGGRGVIGKGAALLIVGLDNGFVAVSGSSLGGQLLALGQQSVDVGAGIGHLIEFHRERTFLSHVSPILSRLAGKRKREAGLPSPASLARCHLSQRERPWQRGKVLWISDKNRYDVLANVMHRVVEKPRKKAYNNSINRVRPCALSAASTGSCAADEGRPAVHGLHPAAAWTWVQARAACGPVPGSETCWIHALLCAVCHTGGRFIFNALSGKIPFY